MLRNVNMEIFYPHPPQKVWRAIANQRALAAWLMDNDFEPKLGHKFQLKPQGFEGTIYCEVIQIDEPKCLSYTWRGSYMSKPTIVTWSLEAVEGGTQVKLEHRGLEKEITKFSQPMPLFLKRQNNFTPKATLEPAMLEPLDRKTLFQFSTEFVNFDPVTVNFYLNGGWHYVLNNTLNNLLTQQNSLNCIDEKQFVF
jgi:uncharacterized protein YndB with AHSA1/START domain